MDQSKIKIARDGKILRMKDMFEVIEDAKALWEEPFNNKEFEVGRGVVIFKDKLCNSISYVMHSFMPMPYHIKDIEPSKYDQTYKKLERTFKEEGLFIIKSRTGVFVDAPEDIKQEVIKHMAEQGYDPKRFK